MQIYLIISVLLAVVSASTASAQQTTRQQSKQASTTTRITKEETVDTEALRNKIAATFPECDYEPNVVYKQVDDQTLQLDILTPHGLSSALAPVLVYIHGGGWSGGDRYNMMRSDVAGVFHHCAKAGIICVSIEYRLNSAKATVLDSVLDCKDSLRFLVKNAQKYHIDPARIGTIGGSAGGHLSLVTALGDPKSFPGDPNLSGYDPLSIRCEVAYYPATDFTDTNLAGRFLGPRATMMFGGPLTEKVDVLSLLSPTVLIRKTSTPVYCFHGDKDTVLPMENSRRLFAKGIEVGADIQYTEVKNGVHGFGADCVPSVDEICTMAAKFVIERLKQ
ncbi:MAG: hypothetical protein RL693_1332 [Verrucomicrobiota bacterium]|jgi:acetyl esterase/lipase